MVSIEPTPDTHSPTTLAHRFAKQASHCGWAISTRHQQLTPPPPDPTEGADAISVASIESSTSDQGGARLMQRFHSLRNSMETMMEKLTRDSARGLDFLAGLRRNAAQDASTEMRRFVERFQSEARTASAQRQSELVIAFYEVGSPVSFAARPACASFPGPARVPLSLVPASLRPRPHTVPRRWRLPWRRLFPDLAYILLPCFPTLPASRFSSS